MQLAYWIPIWEFADLPAFDEPLEPVDDGLPPHAAASRTRAAVATIAAAVRAAGGCARRGRRVTRVLRFILLSSGLDDRAAASGGVRPGRRCPGTVPFAETG
jgi:hypothetical protein